MKTCNGCAYAQWDRTKTGSLHPTGNGVCTFEYKIAPLPECQYWIGGTPSPYGSKVISRKKDNREHCPYYSGNPSARIVAVVPDALTAKKEG